MDDYMTHLPDRSYGPPEDPIATWECLECGYDFKDWDGIDCPNCGSDHIKEVFD